MQRKTINIVVLIVNAVGALGLAQWVSRDKAPPSRWSIDYCRKPSEAREG